MTQSLLGRTAIVTGGAGRGMGRSIALTLAVPGKNLIRVSWQGFGSIAARPPERVDCPLYQRARSRKWVSLER